MTLKGLILKALIRKVFEYINYEYCTQYIQVFAWYNLLIENNADRMSILFPMFLKNIPLNK